MYASCYILTKIENLVPLTPKVSDPDSGHDGSGELEKLEI
jgi:hypothetical protein